MIYTVTLNPTLDITYLVERIVFGDSIKALEVEKCPGGKGINVSRVLRAMGVDSIAISVIGGYAGDEVLNLLHDEGIILQILRIENETRTNVIIRGKQDGREIMIRSAGPPVMKTETERLNRLIFRMATDPEVLVISGSLPQGIEDDMYYRIVNEGRKRGSKVVLDAEGEPFRLGLEGRPHLIKPNLRELEGLAGRTFADDKEIADFAKELVSAGIETVVVSMGAEGAIMIDGRIALKGTVPAIEEETVGAGDSMVAGLVQGMVSGESKEEMFKRGLACGLAAVLNRGPGLATPKFYEEALKRVRMERLRG